MAFVTEKISLQDIEKYGLLEINESLKTTNLYEWTIDRERNIYLRYVGSHWQTPEDIQFSFYWRGRLLRIDLRSLSFKGEQNRPLYQIWEVNSHLRSGLFWLPQELETQRTEITADLKEAVTAQRTAGIAGQYTNYNPTFNF